MINNIQKPSVLIVLYYYYPYVSGLSVYAQRVAEALVKRGYNVTVLTSQFEDNLQLEEDINGVRIVRKKVMFKLNKGMIMPLFWVEVIKMAKQYDYVNMHLPMAETCLAALFIPQHKLVTTYHCDLNLGSRVHERVLTAISYILMRIALSRSRVIIPSSRDYLEHSKMKRFLEKAYPIYPVVTDSEFNHVESRDFFKKLGVQADEKIIGFVGRIVYEKGINYLLECIPYLDKEFSKYRIVIVGDYLKVAGGSIKDELDIYIKEYPNRIIFTGYIEDEDRERFFSGIDVLALPSIDPLEAFGLVQVEAMLCGAPVVASDMPGVREIIKRLKYGRLAKLKDPKDLATQLTAILKHPTQYAPVRSRVVEVFGEEQSIDNYVKQLSNNP